MTINSLEKKIKKELFKKKKFLKNELKKFILKSVLRNKHVNRGQRNYSFVKLSLMGFKKHSLSQQHGICLTSGKLNTSRKKFPFSRQFIKKYTDMGLLQNVKSISW